VIRKFVKKTSCGRTKAGFIVKNVLCPFSISNHSLDFDEELKFSISSDASNKGDIKLLAREPVQNEREKYIEKSFILNKLVTTR
jgi:hypothetical protein